MISSSSFRLESGSESGNFSDVGSVVSPKVLGLIDNMNETLNFQTLPSQESWKTWYTCFDDVASRRGGP